MPSLVELLYINEKDVEEYIWKKSQHMFYTLLPEILYMHIMHGLVLSNK